MTMTTRRDFFSGAAGLAAAPRARSAAAVPAVDVSRIRARDFSDDEIDLAYHLVHFARLANAVRMSEPNRGFIELSVWRAEKDNQPYNARIMESILSLTWFYTAKRSWNPYRGHPALRARLEAAMKFWCGIQSPDGRFSEYKPQGWNLAATAFATKFMAETLRLLKGGPPIDARLHARAADACRRAIRKVLTDPDLFAFGRDYSNQFTNVFAGGPAFLRLYPDAALEGLLIGRIEQSSTEFQSPAGYFYEAGGPDFGYNLGTHHRNVEVAWHYYRRSPAAKILADQETLFCEWLAYNAMPEPGGDHWVLNRAIECRQRRYTTGPIDTPAAEHSLPARAFSTPPAQRRERLRAAREKLEREWPRVEPLPVGSFTAYTPYTFLQRSHHRWHPSQEQIEEARSRMRAWRAETFLHQRVDSRHPQVFTYTRQPHYYAAFTSGPAIRPQQRLGLGLVWTPSHGAVLQSQTGGGETAWEQASRVDAAFEADGRSVAPRTGVRDLAGGRLVIRYQTPKARKRVEFLPDRIRVTVESASPAAEFLPMLAGAPPEAAAGGVSAPGWRISSPHAVNVIRQSGKPLFGNKQLAVVEVKAAGNLSYEIELAGLTATNRA